MSTAWPEGVGLLDFEELDSTNSEAARQIEAGRRGPLWIRANRQNAGRGRQGRVWTAPAGNLSASLVIDCPGPPAEVALRSFVASLALREACEAVTGRGALFTLKWPNDVLMSGRKLAGILLERASLSAPLVLGIGVNLVHAPPADGLRPGGLAPAVLSESGIRVAPAELLVPLAAAFDRWEGRMRAEGFGPVRAAWLDHAARLGQEVTVTRGAETLTGRFETVDAAGALVLNTGAARLAIAAADIHFS